MACGNPGAAADVDSPLMWSDGEAMKELARLVQDMNRNPEFTRQAAELENASLVLSATDTGRELLIALADGRVSVRLFADEPFDVKVRATEQVHWAVLSGQMDADAAFFAGKVHISGSLLTAFRLKNRFLNLLQWHLAPTRAEPKRTTCLEEQT